MSLTYKEFVEAIPRETYAYVYKLLSTLEQYENSSMNKENFHLLTAIYIASKESKYANLNTILDKKHEYPYITSKHNDYESLYNKYIAYLEFDTYKSTDKYQYLSPIDIIEKIYYQTNPFIRLEHIIVNNPIKVIKDLKKSIEDTNKNLIEETLFKNKTVEVSNYIESVLKIERILKNYLTSYKNDYIDKNNKDIIPLSLLLALYKNKGINEYINKSINENKIFETYDINKINYFNITDDNYDIYEMIKYINLFKDINTKEDIIKLVFNKNKIKSNILDKLFTSEEEKNTFINNLTESINNNEEKNINEFNNFYKNISKQTIDFIKLSTKIYTLLLKKIDNQNNTHNELKNSDDADSLAILIAALITDTKLKEFFNYSDITLEKILSYLNISISQKDLENTKLDELIMIKKFKRFIYEGENKNIKNSILITKDDIIKNLSNPSFNKSRIVNNIYINLTNKPNANQNIIENMDNYFEEKINKQNIEIEKKLENIVTKNCITFLKEISILYKNLNKIELYNKEKSYIITTLSEILKDNNFKEFINIYLFIHQYDIDKLTDLNINDLKETNNKVNLKELQEIVLNKLNDIGTKEGFPITKEKFIINFLNTYSKEICSMFNIKQTINVKDAYQIYLNEQNNNIFKNLNVFSKNLVITYNILLNQIDKEKYSHDDILEISILLTTLLNENKLKKYFINNNLTLELVLKELNISKNKLINSSAKYQKCDEISKHINLYDDENLNIKKLFDIEFSKNSLFIENLCEKFNINYHKLATEVTNEKDYIETLTLNEKINLLQEIKITIPEDITPKSILHFGDNITIHYCYISEEIPKIINELNSYDYVEELQKQIDTILNTNSKTTTLRKHIFHKKENSNETKNKLLTNINSLKETIKYNYYKLEKEITEYEQINDYLKIYKIKIEECISKLNKIITEYNELLTKTSNEMESITIKSRLNMLNKKKESFELTKILIEREIIFITNIINTHYLTINNLEISNNIILPLIGAEMTINMGLNSEYTANKLSQNLATLLKSILNKNTKKIEYSIKELTNTSISQATIKKIKENIHNSIESNPLKRRLLKK